MEIGLISDIHGNLPALNTVLEDMPAVDKLVCAGDIVGYNPWPAECVNIIREEADAVVKGNHDRAVKSPPDAHVNHMALEGLQYANEECTADQLKWLDELPRKTWLGDDSFLLVHDHPEYQDKYVQPEEYQNLPRFLDGEDGVFFGHTHIQYAEPVHGVLAVNPGSVGQPRDNDPRAAYAVVNTESMSVTFGRVEYDINRVIEKVEEVGLPSRIGTRLLDGS